MQKIKDSVWRAFSVRNALGAGMATSKAKEKSETVMSSCSILSFFFLCLQPFAFFFSFSLFKVKGACYCLRERRKLPSWIHFIENSSPSLLMTKHQQLLLRPCIDRESPFFNRVEPRTASSCSVTWLALSRARRSAAWLRAQQLTWAAGQAEAGLPQRIWPICPTNCTVKCCQS